MTFMTQTNYLAYKFKILACVLGTVIVILNAACQNTNRSASNVQTSGETPSVVNPSSSASIAFDVESVTLNYKTRNMEIRGKLRNNGTTKPEKVWVWAYFFAPNSEYASGSWSGSPIELNNPFASGNEANVTATGHFHWWDNSHTPKSGYYARVNTSTQSGDAAIVPTEQRNKTATGAYTVRIVQ
jgi:hypothetical protein